MRHCQKVGKLVENQLWTTDHRSAQPSKITPKIATVFVKETITAIELIVKSQCQTAEQTILANA